MKNEANDAKCVTCRTKKRSEEEKRALLNRLSRIEGQVRGVRGMVESDIYCPDILIQVSAISSALSSFAKELLASHIKTCVVADIKENKTESVDELVALLGRTMH